MPATGFVGTPVSSFAPANTLFNLPEVYAAAQQYQQGQQTLGQNEMEMMARASAGLLSLPTEEARAAAYGPTLQQLRQYNFAKNAPDVYPGEAQLRRVALMGTPSSKQAEWNYNTGVNQAGLGTGATGIGTTATTPASGTGTGTVAAQPVEPEALTRAQAVRDGLVKRGLDPDTATAFAANALHESAANPNTGAGDAGASHGLFQWRADRYDRYKSIYGNTPDNAPLDQQLDYVVSELNSTEGAARDRINAAQGPDAKAAAISQYYLRPKDIEAEMGRRSATARQLVSQWGGAGQPATTYVGDSLVEPGGVGGSVGGGVRGANPEAVLARLRDPNATSDTQIRGRNIVLSSGASNRPEHAQLLAMQLQTLKERGAGAVTVLGVGSGVQNAGEVNAQLQQIAERNGARFVALPADQMGKDGIHPTKQGYAALQAQVQAAPAQAPPGGAQPPAPYQVAGPVVAPPAAAPGTTAATPQNGLAPGAPGAPAAATPAPVAQNQMAPPAPAAQPAAPAPQPPRPPAPEADNLTADDRRTLAGMVREDPARFAATKTAMQARNIAQQHQAFEDRRQVAADAATQAERDYQHGRNTQADVLAAQQAVRQAQAAEDAHTKAVREADAAAKAAQLPYASNEKWAQFNNVLRTASPDSQEYAIAYANLAAPVINADGSKVKPVMSAYAKPTYKPPGATEVPDYSEPTVTPATTMNVQQGRVANFADRMAEANPVMDQLDASALTWAQRVKEKGGNFIGYNINSPDYQRLRTAQEAFIVAVTRDESGAAVHPDEFTKYARIYFPQPGEDADTIKLKQRLRKVELDGLAREAGPAYKLPEIKPTSKPPGVTDVTSYDHNGDRIRK